MLGSLCAETIKPVSEGDKIWQLWLSEKWERSLKWERTFFFRKRPNCVQLPKKNWQSCGAVQQPSNELSLRLKCINLIISYFASGQTNQYPTNPLTHGQNNAKKINCCFTDEKKREQDEEDTGMWGRGVGRGRKKKGTKQEDEKIMYDKYYWV